MAPIEMPQEITVVGAEDIEDEGEEEEGGIDVPTEMSPIPGAKEPIIIGEGGLGSLDAVGFGGLSTPREVYAETPNYCMFCDKTFADEKGLIKHRKYSSVHRL